MGEQSFLTRAHASVMCSWWEGATGSRCSVKDGAIVNEDLAVHPVTCRASLSHCSTFKVRLLFHPDLSGFCLSSLYKRKQFHGLSTTSLAQMSGGPQLEGLSPAVSLNSQSKATARFVYYFVP